MHYVEYWGILYHSNCTRVISSISWSKYIYTLNSASCAQIAQAIKQLLSEDW